MQASGCYHYAIIHQGNDCEVHKPVNNIHITVDRIEFVLVPMKVPSSSQQLGYCTHRAMFII